MLDQTASDPGPANKYATSSAADNVATTDHPISQRGAFSMRDGCDPATMSAYSGVVESAAADGSSAGGKRTATIRSRSTSSTRRASRSASELARSSRPSMCVRSAL